MEGSSMAVMEQVEELIETWANADKTETVSTHNQKLLNPIGAIPFDEFLIASPGHQTVMYTAETCDTRLCNGSVHYTPDASSGCCLSS